MSGMHSPKFAELPIPFGNKEISPFYSDFRDRAYKKLCNTPIPDNSVEAYRKIKPITLSFSEYLKKEGEWESRGSGWKKISDCSERDINPFLNVLQKKLESRDNEFFSLLTLAYSREPLYLHIPPNTNMQDLNLTIEIQEGSANAFPVYFIKVGEFSKVSILDTIKVSNNSTQTLLGSLCIIIQEDSSEIEIIFQEELNSNTFHFRDISVLQKKQSSSTISYYNLNGLKGKTKINTHLLERGASTNIFGVAAPTRREFQDVEFTIYHESGHTNSSLRFNTVMKDRAHHVFTGNLIVPRTSSKVEASQVNHNLILDKTSRAESMPKLEVLAEDVKCSHGATMSEVDESQIFYLLSRGIDLKAAKHLIVEGFLTEIIEKTGSDEFRVSILQKLFEKLMV